MRRYIVLLVITGTVWAQTGLDKLVLKNGTEYLGEYSRTEKNIIYFKPQDALSTQPVSVKLIQELKLKDGTILTNDILGFRAYAKLTTEEKAVYDAAKNARRWVLYLPSSILTVSFTMAQVEKIKGRSPFSNDNQAIMFLTGISCFSLLSNYGIFKSFDKKSLGTLRTEEIELYKNIYSKEFRRKIIKANIGGFFTGFFTFLLLAALSPNSGSKWDGPIFTPPDAGI